MAPHQRLCIHWLYTVSLCIAVGACAPPAAVDGLPPQADSRQGFLTPGLSGPAPQLTLISPRIGTVAGGIPVTLTGKNFRPGVSVSFGGAACSGVQILSSTELLVSLPANPRAFGRVPVRISLPDGKSVTRSDLFYYYADSVSWQSAYHYLDQAALSSFVLGDVNGDGKTDVMAADKINASVAVLLSTGDGNFLPPKLTPVVAAPISLIAAELNGDGRLDVVAAGALGPDWSVLLGNDDGTFVVRRLSGIVPNAEGLIAADLNGDGHTDIAYASDRGAMATGILLGRGDGTFLPPKPITPAGLLGYVAAADVNEN